MSKCVWRLSIASSDNYFLICTPKFEPMITTNPTELSRLLADAEQLDILRASPRRAWTSVYMAHQISKGGVTVDNSTHHHYS
eukprot:scaffold72846_cov32-Prasinocladus_malaysianus.AAC.1